jgi:hypothetical protein
MSDLQGLALVAALMVCTLVIGFVVGWTANPSDDHD